MKFGHSHSYDVIVCGAGHAGCEAALALCADGGGYPSAYREYRYRGADEL